MELVFEQSFVFSSYKSRLKNSIIGLGPAHRDSATAHLFIFNHCLSQHNTTKYSGNNSICHPNILHLHASTTGLGLLSIQPSLLPSSSHHKTVFNIFSSLIMDDIFYILHILHANMYFSPSNPHHTISLFFKTSETCKTWVKLLKCIVFMKIETWGSTPVHSSSVSFDVLTH